MSIRTEKVSERRKKKEIRDRWLLSAPALLLILAAGAGPLVIVVVYSFLVPGSHGDVRWEFSTKAWFDVLFTRDIFDGTVSIADAHFSIFWRSAKLAFATMILCLVLGFPTAYFIATRAPRSRSLWLFLITIPFWTNMLIRTFAIQEVIRAEGIINTILMKLGVTSAPIQMMFTDFAIMLGMTYVFLPLMVLPLYASLEKLDFRLIEAGYDLYASSFRRAMADHHSAGEARHHRRLHPCIRAGAILLRDPARSRRRPGSHGRQSDRTAVWPGTKLAARRGAIDYPRHHHSRRDAPLCPQYIEVRRWRPWLNPS